MVIGNRWSALGTEEHSVDNVEFNYNNNIGPGVYTASNRNEYQKH
jgi:hypothetical protein